MIRAVGLTPRGMRYAMREQIIEREKRMERIVADIDRVEWQRHQIDLEKRHEERVAQLEAEEAAIRKRAQDALEEMRRRSDRVEELMLRELEDDEQ